jgi:hypothetical protein
MSGSRGMIFVTENSDMLAGKRDYKAIELFDEYRRRRHGGQSPAEVITLMRELSNAMIDLERQRLIGLIRDWERAQGLHYQAVPPTSQEIRTISNPLAARRLGTGSLQALDTSMRPPYVGSGSLQFNNSTLLYLHIQGESEPLLVTPGTETILGCGGTGSVLSPDVDLSKFGGEEKGVAPLHCTLRRANDTLTISNIDAGAGVYLNGEAIYPQTTYQLRDGDELRLGGMVIWLQFKNPIRRVGA